MAVKMAIGWAALEASCLPSSQEAPRHLTHHEGADCSQGLLGECWWGPGIPRRGVPGFPLALGTELAQRARQYLAPHVGTVFHLTGGNLWPFGSSNWNPGWALAPGRVSGTSVEKQGHCFPGVVGAWLPEGGTGGPTLSPLAPQSARQSFSWQPLEGPQRARFSSQGCLWERPRAQGHGTTGAERVAHVLRQPQVPGSVRGRQGHPVTSW